MVLTGETSVGQSYSWYIRKLAIARIVSRHNWKVHKSQMKLPPARQHSADGIGSSQIAMLSVEYLYSIPSCQKASATSLLASKSIEFQLPYERLAVFLLQEYPYLRHLSSQSLAEGIKVLVAARENCFSFRRTATDCRECCRSEMNF